MAYPIRKFRATGPAARTQLEKEMAGYAESGFAIVNPCPEPAAKDNRLRLPGKRWHSYLTVTTGRNPTWPPLEKLLRISVRERDSINPALF